MTIYANPRALITLWSTIVVGVSSASSGTTHAAPRNNKADETHAAKKAHERGLGATCPSLATWEQVGNTIEGLGGSDDFSGRVVAMSADGTIVALGSYHSSTGSIRVFQIESTEWKQIGDTIFGTADESYAGFGRPLHLNGDGTRFIAGDFSAGTASNPDTGEARVYDYNASTNSWEISFSYVGANDYAYAGNGVAISLDGNHIAISSPYDSTYGTNVGIVQFFDNTSGSWTAAGDVYDTSMKETHWGNVVSMSDDGTVVAIANSLAGDDEEGLVRVYQRGSSAWEVLGNDILGMTSHQKFGKDLYLSGDGSRLVVTSRNGDTSERAEGIVQAYKYNGETDTWDPIGQRFQGAEDGNKLGYSNGGSVALNFDGRRLVIGERFKDSVTKENAGRTIVYQYNDDLDEWCQISQEFWGEEANIRVGTVAMSSDGYIVATGAPGDGTNTGRAQVFEHRTTSQPSETPTLLPTTKPSQAPSAHSCAMMGGLDCAFGSGTFTSICVKKSKKGKAAYSQACKANKEINGLGPGDKLSKDEVIASCGCCQDVPRSKSQKKESSCKLDPACTPSDNTFDVCKVEKGRARVFACVAGLNGKRERRCLDPFDPSIDECGISCAINV